MLTEEALALLLTKAGENASAEITIEGSKVPLRLIQEGYEVQSLEEHLPAPTRTKQAVKIKSPSAFVAYTKRFEIEKRSVVFVNDKQFVAKLDYHGPDEPSWCDHTATYAPQHSHQWSAWLGNNKKQLDQTNFALFIEERLDEISKPSAAELMTAVLHFKEASDQSLVSNQNLDTGEVLFSFSKENKRSSAKFPSSLALTLPIFDYHDPVKLECHVRYRSDNGTLRIWYQFKHDPIDIVRDHFETISEGIKKELKHLPFFEGSV